MKRLMLLGGIHYLLPIIESAHNHGYYVITVDYIPDNIAHKYSDEYHNISILDKEAVLALAKELNIDGIMSFAVDPGVVTAAYVAEKMGLPFQCSYESACILQDKSKFRAFLTNHGFNVPKNKGYSSIDDALSDVDFYNWPVIVKPVDSAGSKGVMRVDDHNNLRNAIEYALSESHSHRFIIEDFLEKKGNSSDSDCFSVDGKLVFASFSEQMFDIDAANPYTPSAYCWPSRISDANQKYLTDEIQRLFDLLKMRSGIYNIETRVCTNGKPYIMEVSPRGGGNRLAEMLKLVTNQDLIDNAVRYAVGDSMDLISSPKYEKNIYEIILHSEKDGVFQGIQIDKEFSEKYLVQKDLWIKKGDQVKSFTGANATIGTLVFDFADKLNLDLSEVMNHIHVLVE